MHRITQVVCIACAVCSMWAVPVKAHTEVLQRPNTPLVSVAEIYEDRLKIEALEGFRSDNSDHMEQVYILGLWACNLYEREGVVISQITESESDGTMLYTRLFYLVACALP